MDQYACRRVAVLNVKQVTDRWAHTSDRLHKGDFSHLVDQEDVTNAFSSTDWEALAACLDDTYLPDDLPLAKHRRENTSMRITAYDGTGDMLTGSGGPFRERKLSTFADITPEQACAHPNWDMGRKISVDSATMMNKGLEVIEAYWLFDLQPDQIEVLIHPQQALHGMVYFRDGSVVAQLAGPDMRTPISYALAWPDLSKL